MNKQQLRNHYKLLRKNYTKTSRVYENILLQKNIIQSSLWQNAKVISLYLAFNNEVTTKLLIESAWRSNKIIAIPSIKTGHQMDMAIFTKTTKLSKNKFGILEIDKTQLNYVAPEEIELCILPALAIDYQGNRLGYGGGYYDRYLSKTRCPILGLIYICSLTSTLLPKENTDISVNYVSMLNQLLKINPSLIN